MRMTACLLDPTPKLKVSTLFDSHNLSPVSELCVGIQVVASFLSRLPDHYLAISIQAETKRRPFSPTDSLYQSLLCD